MLSILKAYLTSEFVERVLDRLFGVNQHPQLLQGKRKAAWIDALTAQRISRAHWIERMLASGSARHNTLIAQLLFYFYAYCLLDDQSCHYDADSDQDGLSDVAERALGSDPLDPKDAQMQAPQLRATQQQGQVKLTILGDKAAYVYELQRRTPPQTHYQTLSHALTPAAGKLQVDYTDRRDNGEYTYRARGCVRYTLPDRGEQQACTPYSNLETQVVQESLKEGPIQLAIRQDIAAPLPLPQDQLTRHLQLSPTVGPVFASQSKARQAILFPYNSPRG